MRSLFPQKRMNGKEVRQLVDALDYKIDLTGKSTPTLTLRTEAGPITVEVPPELAWWAVSLRLAVYPK